MYFVLYDRHMRSIGETYILESWSRTQRAVDFDELKIVGEQIPYSADPFLVVANDRQGRMLFSGLASTPIIDESSKKTSISLKDYLTLFYTEIIVDWGKFKGSTIKEYIDFILSTWRSQIDVGFEKINWDAEDLSEEELDSSIVLGNLIESISVSTLIFNALKYYSLHCDPVLDVFKKTITYRFRKSSKHLISIRLRDFDLSGIEKSFGEYNRATVYSFGFSRNQEWALTEDNSVVRIYPSSSVPDNLLYPAKNRNFIATENTADSLNEAVYNAVMGLAENRYQENIDLDAQQYKSIIDLTQVDFSYRIDVYAENGYYKNLPVGEIETDSNGKHIVRLGHRIQELTQRL